MHTEVLVVKYNISNPASCCACLFTIQQLVYLISKTMKYNQILPRLCLSIFYLVVVQQVLDQDTLAFPQDSSENADELVANTS